MSFLQPSDFKGVIAQSNNEFTLPKLQAYIDRYEFRYLVDLLGSDFFDEFVADLDTAPNITPASVPTSAKFLDIFDAFSLDDGEIVRVSEGFKPMLRFFIFFEYARDNQFDFSLTGATKNKFSNAEIARLVSTNANDNYNRGYETYREIQWFIEDNPNNSDYTLENGQPKETISWL